MATANGNSSLSCTNERRLDNISWDDYFMSAALLTALRSKDPNTQVGACIVDNKNRMVACGYNGFPRNCDDDVFPWTKNSENLLKNKHMYVVHAEANAILNKNLADITGSRMYTALFPCNECAKLIIQSGITEIIYMSDKYGNKPSFLASRRMFDHVGIKCRQFQPTRNRIIIDFDNWIEKTETDLTLSPLKFEK